MSHTLPVVDVASLVSLTQDITDDAIPTEARAVAERLGQIYEDIGFLVITNHGVNKKTVEDLVLAQEKFFALPLEKKMALASNKYNPQNQHVYRGYFPATVNGKEGLDLCDYRITPQDVVPELSNTEPCVWPQFEAEEDTQWFRDVASRYFDELMDLARRLMRALAVALGQPVHFFDQLNMFEKTLTTLRFNHYFQTLEASPVVVTAVPHNDATPDSGNIDRVTEEELKAEPRLSCETHVDSVFLTILYQDTVGGLQVYARDGSWLDVPANIPDSFVVNLGFAMQRWTNDRYIATKHRVVHISAPERVSIPFFFEGRHDTLIDPAALQPHVPPRYDPICYGPYIAESVKRFREYQREEQKNDAS
eukprot:TRINITY_DN1279_c0_g2_i2.p1 TRINITY_DN1279_c0_g2~~TRINITY_DN1279_c0_g2_i2.p1  ORF type:complete len:384 (-),score=92.08 TRINITY_DN1279_c0_g2_i2:162-1253(-)